MYLVIQCNCPYFSTCRLIQSVKNLIRRVCVTCLGLLFHSCSFGIVLLTDWRRWIWWSIWTTGTTTSFTAYKTTGYFYYSLTDFMVKCQTTLCITAAQVTAYTDTDTDTDTLYRESYNIMLKNAKMTFLTSTWRNWDLGICSSCRISSSSSWGTEYCLWYKTRHEWNKSSSLSSPFCTATCAINTAKFNRESDQSGSTNWNTFCTWGSFYKAQKIMDL